MQKRTALLFGSSGAVGSEVLRALLRNPFWDEIILVGRKSASTKVTDVLSDEGIDANNPRVTIKILPDLANVDKDESLLKVKADACFIATGVSQAQKVSIHEYLSIEVDMTSSIARLCNHIQVRYVSLLSSVDNAEDPKPYTEEELSKYKDSTPLGWMGMLSCFARVKSLQDVGVIAATKDVPFIRLFQPSSIVTKEIRYGWIDWTIFKLSKVFDPILPCKYHSVEVRLLGAAMAEDAVELLSADKGIEESKVNSTMQQVARLSYGDYVRIAGTKFE